MGQNKRVRTAARAVVENMEPRRLMSANPVDLGPNPFDAEYDVYAAGGGVVSYVIPVGTALTVNQFYLGDDPKTPDVEQMYQARSLDIASLPSKFSFQAIDTNEGGQTVVAWSERVTGSSTYAVKAKTIGANGDLSAPTVTVATGRASWVGAVGVAIDKNGAYTVVYADQGGGGFALTTDVKLNRVVGGKAGKTVAVGKTNGTNIVQSLTAIDGSEEGAVVVAWSSGNGGTSAQRYTSALAKSGSVISVNHPDRTWEIVDSIDVTPDGSRFVVTVDAGSPRPAEALPLFEEALAKQRARLGPDHPQTLEAMSNLAATHKIMGRADLALPLIEQSVAGQTKTLGPDHPDTLNSMNTLAATYLDSGQLGKAMPLFEQLLAKQRKVLGPDDPVTLQTLGNLGSTYLSAERLDQALPTLQEALNKKREVLGPDDQSTVTTMNNLGWAYLTAGRLDEALPLLEATLNKRRATVAPDDPGLLLTKSLLGEGYHTVGRFNEALPLLEEALAKRREMLEPDHPDTLRTMRSLAAAYQKSGRPDEARPLLDHVAAKQTSTTRPAR